MKQRRSVCTLTGDRRTHEYIILGVGFYQRVSTQKWSPEMIERHVECGIRFGSRYVAFRSAAKHFRNGEPAITKGEH